MAFEAYALLGPIKFKDDLLSLKNNSTSLIKVSVELNFLGVIVLLNAISLSTAVLFVIKLGLI